MSPVFKVSNYVDAYRLRAKYSRDVHELDGRRGFRRLTEFTNLQICESVHIDSVDSLVDIGCGDGCLLTMAKERGVQNAIGLSGSEEEASGSAMLDSTSCRPLPIRFLYLTIQRRW